MTESRTMNEVSAEAGWLSRLQDCCTALRVWSNEICEPVAERVGWRGTSSVLATVEHCGWALSELGTLIVALERDERFAAHRRALCELRARLDTARWLAETLCDSDDPSIAEKSPSQIGTRLAPGGAAAFGFESAVRLLEEVAAEVVERLGSREVCEDAADRDVVDIAGALTPALEAVQELALAARCALEEECDLADRLVVDWLADVVREALVRVARLGSARGEVREHESDADVITIMREITARACEELAACTKGPYLDVLSIHAAASPDMTRLVAGGQRAVESLLHELIESGSAVLDRKNAIQLDEVRLALDEGAAVASVSARTRVRVPRNVGVDGRDAMESSAALRRLEASLASGLARACGAKLGQTKPRVVASVLVEVSELVRQIGLMMLFVASCGEGEAGESADGRLRAVARLRVLFAGEQLQRCGRGLGLQAAVQRRSDDAPDPSGGATGLVRVRGAAAAAVLTGREQAGNRVVRFVRSLRPDVWSGGARWTPWSRVRGR